MIKKFNEMKEENINKKTNDNKEMFIKSLGTLFYSWGGDTPPEVYWGINELLDWYEKEFNVTIDRFDEENPDYFEQVIKSIRYS